MRELNIFSDSISVCNEQLAYKKAFLKKFGNKIDADDPFYFDDVDIVDGVTGETIRGAQLDIDTWNSITRVLIKYFHIDL